MKRKAKELQLAKREARKEGRTHYSGGFGGGGVHGVHDSRGSGSMGMSVDTQTLSDTRPSYNAGGSR